MPARVVIVVIAALLLSLLLLRQNSSDVRAVAASNPPITGQCTGEQQKVIKGDVTIKGREGTYAITSLKHSRTSPYDASSGLLTGQRQHAPLVFTTNVSQATPKLLQAQSNNENLTSCTFNFWRLSPSGLEQNYFRIKLTNAHIVRYDLAGRPGGADSVTFSLIYQHIQWTYVGGDLVASDDWVNNAG